ncbi:hypothetical protein DDI_3324 [Dickeya dianthicola RNS04.9]|nr:hypothetical protein DDI_3324 [Dickeya dianthicola RNS04.9]
MTAEPANEPNGFPAAGTCGGKTVFGINTPVILLCYFAIKTARINSVML